MDVIYRDPIFTGPPSRVESTLRKSIAAYVRGGIGYRIGFTNNPETRASQRPYNNGHYGEMIVLYRTTSDRFVRQLERALIDYFWETEGLEVEIGGGGGPKGEPPHYLYIAR